MSRVGKKPVSLPEKVKVSVSGRTVQVEGPKGKLSMSHHPLVAVAVKDNAVVVTRPNNTNEVRALHGLTRALINNMVTGVSQGFTREMEIQGVGYRAEMKGTAINLSLGFSHAVEFKLPTGVSATVDDKKTRITLSSIDRQLLGATAAKLRSLRPPEPYGGKGVRYANENVRRKEGKSGAK
ncbi:MAG: 50S ribosomal protein L6 [Myxococcota bacterium]